MKNRKFGLAFSVIAALMLFVLPVAGAVTAFTGLSGFVAVPSVIASSYLIERNAGFFLPKNFVHMTGLTQHGLRVEVWVTTLVTEFFKANVFLNYAVNDDMHVLAGKTVNVPYSGAASAAQVNRTVFPATTSSRTDTVISYNLDEITTDPRRIPNADQYELSYDLRASVMKQDTDTINRIGAELMLLKWAPTVANVIRTSGAATAARLTGQTGNRNAFVEADLMKAMSLFNAQDIPQEGRYVMMDAFMYDDFVKSLSATSSKDFSRYYDAEKGIVGKLHTFNIMMRSTSLVYNSTATAVKAYGTAVAATDQAAALCWHEGSVRRAMGDVEMFDNPGQAIYYGDVISCLLRIGGVIGRSDGKGVVAISQQ